MSITGDQYKATHKLGRWFSKQTQQTVEIASSIGTGISDVLTYFVESLPYEKHEICFLSMSQQEVISFSFKRFHTYHIESFLYAFHRDYDFSIKNMEDPDYVWKKKLRKKSDYKLFIVLNGQNVPRYMIRDLQLLEMPIVIQTDRNILVDENSWIVKSKPDITMSDITDKYQKSALIYLLDRIKKGDLKTGYYGDINILKKEEINTRVMKSANMIITLTEDLAQLLNDRYKNIVLDRKTSINNINDRLIVSGEIHNCYIVDRFNDDLRVYLKQGDICNIKRINPHREGTKYVKAKIGFYYYDALTDEIVIDRFYLNKINRKSTQVKPDDFDIIQFDYAFALPCGQTVRNVWDHTIVTLEDFTDDEKKFSSHVYSALTRSSRRITLYI